MKWLLLRSVADSKRAAQLRRSAASSFCLIRKFAIEVNVLTQVTCAVIIRYRSTAGHHQQHWG